MDVFWGGSSKEYFFEVGYICVHYRVYRKIRAVQSVCSIFSGVSTNLAFRGRVPVTTVLRISGIAKKSISAPHSCE